MFYLNNSVALIFLNPEVGIKSYYSNVTAKDKQDAALYLGIGYINPSGFTIGTGFLTGSTKREKGLFENFDNTYSTNIHYSNALDAMVGKIFRDQGFYLNVQAGVNVSTLKIEGTINEVEPEYKFSPKVKISFGKDLFHKTYLNLNYHHIFSSKKLLIHPNEPYSNKGFTSQGVVSIGILQVLD